MCGEPAAPADRITSRPASTRLTKPPGPPRHPCERDLLVYVATHHQAVGPTPSGKFDGPPPPQRWKRPHGHVAGSANTSQNRGAVKLCEARSTGPDPLSY